MKKSKPKPRNLLSSKKNRALSTIAATLLLTQTGPWMLRAMEQFKKDFFGIPLIDFGSGEIVWIIRDKDFDQNAGKALIREMERLKVKK